jgi:3',5'-cyclic AMP phosphodiesterase CpdA
MLPPLNSQRTMSKRIPSLFFLLLFCSRVLPAQEIKIAFLADVHFHDIHPNFSDIDFRGVPHPVDGKPVLARSMASQLRSTRIFNENYFAFKVALDDIVAKGIKIVALPGDYTDDGQAYNLVGLQAILKEYTEKHGLRFLITTGNHDPLGPFRQDGGKSDFLDAKGRTFGIYSKGDKGIITQDIAPSGYEEILSTLESFGFTPQPSYLHWSTPFDTALEEIYHYEKAKVASSYSQRRYEISPGYTIPDFSYLVEPVEGVWILALDGNTYIPKSTNGDPTNSNAYKTAGIGYNEVLSYKKHLIPWIKKVSEEARKRGKVLVAFSHYPAIDYNDDANREIARLLGPTKWQLHRSPTEEVAQALSSAGVQLHFGGHMHINDTGVRKYPNGNFLVNIQVPSLAAYIPAYKILTIKSPTKFTVSTEIIEDVHDFNYLFPLYEKEHLLLKETGKAWNSEILKTTSYSDFMLFHLKELVRLRHVPSDWPKDYLVEVQNWTSEDWFAAFKIKFKPSLWTTEDLLFDLYKFQSADELAKRDIPMKRRKDYKRLQATSSPNEQHTLLFELLKKLSTGAPADHFTIDLKKQKIKKHHLPRTTGN